MSIEMPADFFTSMTEAEVNAFNHLVSATGSTVGKNAFIGRPGNFVDSWHFYLTTPVTATPPFWAKEEFKNLAYEAKADAVFKDRDVIQAWIMSIIYSMPVYCDKTLNEFKIASIGAIEPGFYKQPNENRSWPVYRVTITFDIIFETNQEGTDDT